jgi:hypothetical protein
MNRVVNKLRAILGIAHVRKYPDGTYGIVERCCGDLCGWQASNNYFWFSRSEQDKQTRFKTADEAWSSFTQRAVVA